MFTLLVIAFVLYSIASIPWQIAVVRAHVSLGAAVLAFGPQVFAAVMLCLYLASFGLGIVAFLVLLPSIVGILVGIVLGLVD